MNGHGARYLFVFKESFTIALDRLYDDCMTIGVIAIMVIMDRKTNLICARSSIEMGNVVVI